LFLPFKKTKPKQKNHDQTPKHPNRNKDCFVMVLQLEKAGSGKEEDVQDNRNDPVVFWL